MPHKLRAVDALKAFHLEQRLERVFAFGLEIIGQHDVIVGDNQQSFLRDRLGVIGDRAVGRWVRRGRDGAPFGERLLGEGLVSLIPVDHAPVGRVRPAGVRLNGSRLHHLAGVEE